MATTEEPGGDHARGAVLLSGSRPRRNAVSPYLGVTMDQLIAKKYGRDTILESIQLAVEEDGNLGAQRHFWTKLQVRNSVETPNPISGRGLGHRVFTSLSPTCLHLDRPLYKR